MRDVQVNITIDRFGDQAPNGFHQQVSIYTDDNDLTTAIAAAIGEVVNYFGPDKVDKENPICTACNVFIRDYEQGKDEVLTILK